MKTIKTLILSAAIIAISVIANAGDDDVKVTVDLTQCERLDDDLKGRHVYDCNGVIVKRKSYLTRKLEKWLDKDD